MNQLQTISRYVDSTPIIMKFNENLLNFKNDEDYLAIVESICKTLNIIDNIKFLGLKVVPNSLEDENIMEISRTIRVMLKFEVKLKGEKEIFERELYLPKLLNGNYFFLKGNKYFPIFQLIDRGIFTSKKYFVLKARLMPIKLAYKKAFFNDSTGEKIHCTEFNLNMFKNEISPAFYYFAKFGVQETFDYFGFEKDDLFFVKDIGEVDADEFYVFAFTKTNILCARKQIFQENTVEASILNMFMVSLSKLSRKFNIEHETWYNIFGGLFTKSNQRATKAKKVLFSFERALDDFTKTILYEIEDENKTDIYAFVKWMIYNFENCKHQDPLDLKFKRIQCWQYILKPLLYSFSKSVYRINNTKNVTMKTFENILNINPNFLTQSLLTNKLLRYSDTVNNMDIFNLLKVTFKDNMKNVSDQYRDVHPSYIGKISLISSGAEDPGMTTCLTPFVNINERCELE